MSVAEDVQEAKNVFKIALLCALWYGASSTGGVIAKILLSEFPYPVTLVMVQHLCLIICLPPLIKCWQIPVRSALARRYYLTMIIPLAAGKFLSNASASVSIWKVPLSYAHTVKATMPLWTVLLSRVLVGETQTTQVYLSLLPIIGGVLVATMTELSFDIIGLVTALAATIGFSLQNIFTKKTMKDTNIHHLQLLLLLARISAGCFLPVWFLTDVMRISTDESLVPSDGSHANIVRCVTLLIVDGFLNFLQSMAAFSLLSLISPLSYSVANATKRIVVISFSLLMMRNPVTTANLCGMAMAVGGVFCYNKTKYDQNVAKRRQESLPFVQSDSDLIQAVKQLDANRASLYHAATAGFHPSASMTTAGSIEGVLRGSDARNAYQLTNGVINDHFMLNGNGYPNGSVTSVYPNHPLRVAAQDDFTPNGRQQTLYHM